jgi:hypothetical protein
MNLRSVSPLLAARSTVLQCRRSFFSWCSCFKLRQISNAVVRWLSGHRSVGSPDKPDSFGPIVTLHFPSVIRSSLCPNHLEKSETNGTPRLLAGMNREEPACF